jgi:hypothetical protein
MLRSVPALLASASDSGDRNDESGSVQIPDLPVEGGQCLVEAGGVELHRVS